MNLPYLGDNLRYAVGESIVKFLLSSVVVNSLKYFLVSVGENTLESRYPLY
jgi:hypothetical protein